MNEFDSDGALSDDDEIPTIPSDIALRLSLNPIDLSDMHNTEVINLLNLINDDLRKQSFNDTETLRLFQDLCSYFLTIPSSFILGHVTFDRKDVVGRGGEATVYRGHLTEDNHSRPVVVREVVLPPRDWKSTLGRKVIRVRNHQVRHIV
ncbi:hypothetical protein DL93DRAFT_1999098 [Clavulina sp. PMI_390]|nr:hypothetical protein DL93DRAFT_1999098 [Clavulina sp. PMI_390]